MKFFIFVKKLWSKNAASNIMVMVIICLTCYLTSMLFNLFYDYYGNYLYFRDTWLNNSLLFMGGDASGTSVDGEPMKKMAEYAENSQIVKGISHMMTFTSSELHSNIYIYDETTAAFMKDMVILEGDWLFENDDYAGEYYPIAVYNGDYEIGSIIDLDVYMSMVYQPLNGYVPDKKTDVKCIVVGIIDGFDPFCFKLEGFKTNNVCMITDPFDNFISERITTFFFPYDDELFHKYAYANDDALIYFKEDASEFEKAEFYKVAKQLGYCCLGSEMIAATREEANKRFNENFFIFYTITGLMLISIICISFLNIKKVSKNFSVYYLNGCTFMRSVAIYFTYFISMYMISFVIFFVATTLQSRLMSQSMALKIQSFIYTVDYKVALAACIVGIFISAVSTAVPFILMKRKTPIQNIKEA